MGKSGIDSCSTTNQNKGKKGEECERNSSDTTGYMNREHYLPLFTLRQVEMKTNAMVLRMEALLKDGEPMILLCYVLKIGVIFNTTLP